MASNTDHGKDTNDAERLDTPTAPETMDVSDGTGTEATDIENTSVIDLKEIDQDVPLIHIQGAKHRKHGQKMSKEHIARIKRRHRRERFLVKLDLALFAIVCLGGAAALIGVQALQ
ncbi:hypothetical protein JS528_07230 [Bifidobacterium sp. MA2]|uniref:Uncharacterized protein n=1 Tax=Bifidobacterium santillanense TaxID=2809028 RepID=A0ABS5UQ95_9BIFI|nr:hypothetical protein [Bifidobacterium santillanense]MBT1173145.1 hypothetical protein [Bifidobacterium santillanense]